MILNLWIIQRSDGVPSTPQIFTDSEKAKAEWLRMWDLGYRRDRAGRPVRKSKAWSKEYLITEEIYGSLMHPVEYEIRQWVVAIEI